MKKLIILFSFLMLVALMSTDVPYYSGYRPVFMYRSHMESAVKMKEPRTMLDPGKIYLKDDYIFVNEKYRGIHVIDNSNPEDPQKTGFIHVDGCIDMAMKDDVLYADNAVDLIAIRLFDDMTGMEVTERIRNVFPELRSPDGYPIPWKMQEERPENSIIVRWEKTTNN